MSNGENSSQYSHRDTHLLVVAYQDIDTINKSYIVHESLRGTKQLLRSRKVAEILFS